MSEFVTRVKISALFLSFQFWRKIRLCEGVCLICRSSSHKQANLMAMVKRTKGVVQFFIIINFVQTFCYLWPNWPRNLSMLRGYLFAFIPACFHLSHPEAPLWVGLEVQHLHIIFVLAWQNSLYMPSWSPSCLNSKFEHDSTVLLLLPLLWMLQHTVYHALLCTGD